MIELPITDTGRVFGMRQITRITQTRTGTHQAHVITTRTDLPRRTGAARNRGPDGG